MAEDKSVEWNAMMKEGTWAQRCPRCGYARINVRHWPPPRTYVIEGPDECNYFGTARTPATESAP